MVEKLKKTRLQAAGPAVHHTGSGEVQCDSCTGFEQKAVESCLDCRSSYCQIHLQHHENLFRGKINNLMDATRPLQEIICLQHDKMLEMYCRTDQQCVCMLCSVDEHKNHHNCSDNRETGKLLFTGSHELQLMSFLFIFVVWFFFSLSQSERLM